MTKIDEIPGKVVSTWNPDVKAVIDTWKSYGVTLDEFRQFVLVKGVRYAKGRRAIAWIVDSSGARGVFSQQIQDFIGAEVFPSFVKIGVKYFITVLPKSAMTKMTVKRYSRKAGPLGLELVEVGSVDDAIAFLKENK